LPYGGFNKWYLHVNFRFLRISRASDHFLLDLLENNIIGTPGSSMLYQHLGVSNKIRNIANPFFVCLMKASRAIATCCFCKRTPVNSKIENVSFYIRYFSFKDIYRRKHNAPKRKSGISGLRNDINALLRGKRSSYLAKSDEVAHNQKMSLSQAETQQI
jgi:hypothetical protein